MRLVANEMSAYLQHIFIQTVIHSHSKHNVNARNLNHLLQETQAADTKDYTMRSVHAYVVRHMI